MPPTPRAMAPTSFCSLLVLLLAVPAVLGSRDLQRWQRGGGSGGDGGDWGGDDRAPYGGRASRHADVAAAEGGLPALRHGRAGAAEAPAAAAGEQNAPPEPASAPTRNTLPEPAPAPSQGAQPAAPPAAPAAPASSSQPAMASPTAAGNTTGGPGDAALQAVLDLHNTLRARHGVPPLAWSEELHAYAQNWVNGCSHTHSMTDADWTKGECIAWGQRPFLAAAQEEWASEEPQYDYARPGYSDGTAHFTQMVWKGSTQLGCAAAQCSDGPFYSCNYLPPGNQDGKFADNVLPPVQKR